jgi:FAD-dependent oxidoreductase family protein
LPRYETPLVLCDFFVAVCRATGALLPELACVGDFANTGGSQGRLSQKLRVELLLRAARCRARVYKYDLNRTLNLLPNDEPYPTSYRAITPRASDARNLLNRVTLSATDVADSAVRMDTTFMMLGEAAGRQQP